MFIVCAMIRKDNFQPSEFKEWYKHSGTNVMDMYDIWSLNNTIYSAQEWKKGSNPFIRVEGRSMNRMPLYTFSSFFFKNGILLNIEMLYLEVSSG